MNYNSKAILGDKSRYIGNNVSKKNHLGSFFVYQLKNMSIKVNICYNLINEGVVRTLCFYYSFFVLLVWGGYMLEDQRSLTEKERSLTEKERILTEKERVLAEKERVLIEKEVNDKIIEYSQESLRMECQREENLIQQSSSNLTTVSILLVALFTIIFELLDRLPERLSLLISIFGIILSFILIASIFFSCKSQWLYRRKYKRTPYELREHIRLNQSDYFKGNGFQEQTINDIESIQGRAISNNSKRVRDMVASSYLIYLFLALLIIFCITILIAL